MARCLKCIHKNVCNSCRLETEHLYGECPDYLTADVVPKSEVDKIISEWAWLHADTLNKLKKAKAEVAREIFEEIEKSCRTFGVYGVHGYMMDDIAELKKKYTEGET